MTLTHNLSLYKSIKYKGINGLLTYHLEELDMNQQLKEPPNFGLSKNVNFKDKKTMKYRKVFVSINFYRLQKIS